MNGIIVTLVSISAASIVVVLVAIAAYIVVAIIVTTITRQSHKGCWGGGCG